MKKSRPRSRGLRFGRLTQLALRALLSLALVLGGGAGARPPAARATAFFLVNNDGDFVGADCPSTCTLRAAVAEAVSGDIILFPSTPFTVTFDANLGTLTLSKSLMIQAGTDAITPVVLNGANLSNLSGPVVRVTGEGVVVDLEGVTIRNGPQGGIVIEPGARLNLRDSAVISNINTGITNSGVLDAVNVTLSGNSGGALVNVGVGAVTLTNVTIAHNTGLLALAGGVANSGATVNMQNTILTGNTAQGFALNCRGTLTSLGNNLVDLLNDPALDPPPCVLAPPSQPSDKVNVAAGVGALQDNGGATPTHALLSGSPGIDSGNPASCPDKDQRGVPRLFGAACDIGAFEVPVVRLSAANFSGLETVNPATFTASLEAALPFTLTAHFNTADGLAQAGLDYSAVTGGALTFAPGNTLAVGAVPVTANALYTGDRWLTVALSPTVGQGQSAPLTGVLTLLDAQPPPVATVASGEASVLKSAGSVVVTATLDTVSGVTATVRYSTADGTALAGRDYVARTGSLIFPPGQTVQTTTLTLVNDGQYYGDRVFGVTLSQPLSATVGSPGAMAITILDDNPRRVFLPSIMSPYTERESNDTQAKANGPLERGRAYRGGNKGDLDVDFFFFDASGSGTISVNVSNLIYPAQVQVRNDRSNQPLPGGFAGAPPYQLNVVAVQPGRYYLVIVTPAGYTGGDYMLTVHYP